LNPYVDGADRFRLEGGSVGDGFGLFVGLPLGLTGTVLVAGSWPYVSFYLDGPWSELGKFLLGSLLVLIGILAALGGETWVLDSRSRTFVRTWRVMRWTWMRRVADFGSVREVRCTRLVVGDGAQESFAVEIVLPGDKICRLATRANLLEALAMSATLCGLLDLPLGRGSE
jgi:hypothetical protein